MTDPIVGIDLGTSNSVVAYADATGTVRVLADDAGGKVHPSVVSFHPNGGVVVGAAAKQRKVIDPANTIYSVKRLIGRAFRSPEVQTTIGRTPFVIKEGPNNAPLIATRGGEFAVPEISAIVLDHVRNVAAARLEAPVNRAVVTVPASFNDAQRSATATAGAIAGLTVVRVLNEPTAAALAYGHTRQLREIIAVYDFGGGTFDITFLKLEDQVYEVLGTSGDTFLGGDDLDERLVEKMVAKFLAENRMDLRTNEVAMMRLRAVAEQTKIELSRRSRAVVRIDEIAYGKGGAPLNLQIEISRDEFIREVSDLIDRTFPVCSEALQLAQLKLDQIADVILVGGSTKIPYVRDQVAKFFGKAARADVNPEDAVAAGAALQATSLERILARRPTTSRQRVIAAGPTASIGDDEPTNNVPVLELVESGATMAPSELTLQQRPVKRPTAGYPVVRKTTEVTKPDTVYSMTRSGVRDEVAAPERYPSAPVASGDSLTDPLIEPPSPFETRTPPPGTAALGRITRPVAAAVPPPTPFQPQTLVAAPAAFQLDIESAAIAADHPMARPTTMPGSAVPPPPLPRAAAKSPHQVTAPMPPDLRDPHRPPQQYPVISLEDPEPYTDPYADAIAEASDAVDRVPAAGPSAHTMVAPPPAPPPAPMTTSRGFQAPVAPPPTQFAAIAPPLPPPQAAMAPQSLPPPFAPGGQLPRGTFPGFEPAAPPVQSPAALYQQAQQLPTFPVAPPRPAPVLLEVTPRGVGIATVAGFCEELIRRNARVPTEARRLFSTSRDRQDVVRIVVVQGESRRLDNNVVIGDLVLGGLPPRPRGETSIEVTFALDASGVLNVRARDAQTGAEQRATLALVGDVPEEELAASRDRLKKLKS